MKMDGYTQYRQLIDKIAEVCDGLQARYIAAAHRFATELIQAVV
jgi:hypothetical protein